MYKVLIVEDDKDIILMYEDIVEDLALAQKITFLTARTQPEAEMFFSDNPDISLITLDGKVPGGQDTTTLPLVIKFRKRFKGPMIAASSNEDLAKLMVETGCSHRSPKGLSLFKLLMIILDI